MTLRASLRPPTFALVLLCACALAPAPAAFAAAATCDPPAQGPPHKWCPPANQVTVTFNSSLDPALETMFGTAAMREAAFQQAVNDWNGALTSVGATLRLVGQIDATRWATDQATQICNEPLPPNLPVFADDRTAYFPDTRNETSTGRNPVPPGLAPAAAGAPGWIVPVGAAVPDTMGGSLQIENALAITALQLDPQNAACITEADIVWYTHTPFLPVIGPAQCVRTSWDYTYPGAPAATRYDFYSVILHELGHVLGLDHQIDDGSGANVMQAYIGKGQRRVIGPKELMCLCERYGPPAGNCALVTPVHHSTWGRLKSTYR